MTARLLTTPRVPALRGWVMVTTRPKHRYIRAIEETFARSKDESFALLFEMRRKVAGGSPASPARAGRVVAKNFGYRPIKVRLEPVPQ